MVWFSIFCNAKTNVSYINVPAGATCILKDAEGGTATFTVNSIWTTILGYPTATIIWSYSP
ncbi:MAG: hypothetical protein KAR55_00440 [Thermoplasmatales archaeon]|nr:hypothetical protein [Thermoplasmatales archaeon]